MNPLVQERNHKFHLPAGDYKKQILRVIDTQLPDTITYKKPLIWTIEQFNFGSTKYSAIILNVQEYGATLTFRTQDRGISFELTLPELSTAPPPRKRWLGLF